MSLLIFFILLSIGVSFLCSMLEAVILSVTPTYLASLKTTQPRLYQAVHHLKADIETPLASILTFNTVAHTIGAAGAGAQAQKLFGSEILALFSAALTFAILFFSEIIPKSIGAGSWKTLLPLCATILKPMILAALPVTWLSKHVSRLFKQAPEPVSKDEISAMADIGLSDGALGRSEHRALKSLIHFEEVHTTDILTPREKVASLEQNTPLAQAYELIQAYPFSRIPVLTTTRKQPVGYVLRTQLLAAYIEKSSGTLESIILPLSTVPSVTPLPKLFQRMLAKREHLCAVIDDQRNFLGIITLEDIIEHMLDLEIYDEQDHLAPQ